jgi:hypothetical protein
MQRKDTLIIVLSDLHSGSTKALFPNRQWQGKHQNYLPTEKQRGVWKHFEQCASLGAKMRRGKRLIIIHDGDAIEGIHHETREIVTLIPAEQVEIHVELMDHFMRKVGFNRKAGDRLFYVTGTEAHTGDWEDVIGEDLGAEKNEAGIRCFDNLELDVNGRLIWCAHHGPGKGEGANEGNSMRNWLKNIYFDRLKHGLPIPDVVMTGHRHGVLYNTFVMDFKTIHGMNIPSWQMKTRYVYLRAPMSVNEVGAVYIEIGVDGTIKQPYVLRMETGGVEGCAL